MPHEDVSPSARISILPGLPRLRQNRECRLRTRAASCGSIVASAATARVFPWCLPDTPATRRRLRKTSTEKCNRTRMNVSMKSLSYGIACKTATFWGVMCRIG